MEFCGVWWRLMLVELAHFLSFSWVMSGDRSSNAAEFHSREKTALSSISSALFVHSLAPAKKGQLVWLIDWLVCLSWSGLAHSIQEEVGYEVEGQAIHSSIIDLLKKEVKFDWGRVKGERLESKPITNNPRHKRKFTFFIKRAAEVNLSLHSTPENKKKNKFIFFSSSIEFVKWKGRIKRLL